MRNFLRTRGHIVLTFRSAKELLESPYLNETSCVISDVQMPAMNGLELLAQVRVRGYCAPFIFITGSSPDERVRDRALKAGAVCFLAEPVAAPDLIACLDAALQHGNGGRN
jgi:FixJ family two-component response regulator